MKKRIAALAAAAIALTAALPASAHDGWTQTAAPIIAAGQVAYVELLLGNHSNDHASYRIEGNWSEDTTKTYVVTPDGRKVDISGTMFYTGEISESSNPKINNSYVASFSAAAPGAYIVSVEGDSIFAHGGVASRTLRSAKSFVAIADVPLADRAKDLRGFSAAISTDRAEWTPLFNPAAAHPNRTVSMRLLLRGEPLAGVEATLIRRSNSESERLTTDENGVVTFQTGAADYYLLRAKPSTDEKADGEYETTNYEATATFVIQNVASALPGSPASALPHVFVNGSPVDPAGLALADGSLTVDADWLRSAVDAGIEGDGAIGLRAAAEATGAVVEYFPAVGAVGAAVHLYVR